MSSPKVKILFLAANPHDHKHIEVYNEYKEIKQNIERVPYKDVLELTLAPGITSADLVETLAIEKPQVLHFSGHAEKNGIIINGPGGKSMVINKKILTNILGNLHPSIQLVVLNACKTDPQAKLFANTIDCSIGITGEINDSTAVLFATNFYLMIALGYSIQKAFDLSINNLVLNQHADADQYKLHHKEGIDPNDIYLLDKLTYKGNLFLHDPLIWNSFFIIIEYIQSIHNFFLTLQLSYLNELIKKNDEIFKKSDIGRIESFRNYWNLYNKEYNTNLQNMDEEIINEAFSRIQTIEDKTTINTLKDIESKFYQNIIRAIETYDNCHKELSKKIDQDFMRIIKDHVERTTTTYDLSMKASGLIVNTGELLKKLIELLH